MGLGKTLSGERSRENHEVAERLVEQATQAPSQKGEVWPLKRNR